MFEFSEGYKAKARERLAQIEESLTPQALAVARNLFKDFEQSAPERKPDMDDEPSSAWLIYLIGIWVLAGMARAQEHAQICAPAEVLLRQFSETHKERVIWQGVVPQETGRPIEIVLMQGEKNTWTMFTLTAGVACIVASGKDANPSLADKGI
jgi:hypothetical protein